MYRSMGASYSSLEMQWLFRTIKRVILRENNMFSLNNNLVEIRIRSAWQAFLEGLRSPSFVAYLY